MLTIDSPAPLQVAQRRGHDPWRLHADNPGGPALGSARIPIRGHGWPVPPVRGRYRVVALAGGAGQGTEWVEMTPSVTDEGAYATDIEVPAGGWYRLEVEAASDSGARRSARVEPIGVGEVFLVAGQSYATSCHERLTTIDDPFGRVVATSPEHPVWRVAHDPQPGIERRIDPATLEALMTMLAGIDMGFPNGVTSPFRGSVWPSVANLLLPIARVPVAFVHTAVGGTAIEHWRRGSLLFDNLRRGVEQAGDLRAVLWQQGESDVSAGTTSAVYRDALTALRSDLAAATGLDLPWLVAVSTHHPTGPQSAAAVAAIREAVHEVWTRPGFVAGPDTDVLMGIGEHRADASHGAHFTARGQALAGALWFNSIWTFLSSAECAAWETAGGGSTGSRRASPAGGDDALVGGTR